MCRRRDRTGLSVWRSVRGSCSRTRWSRRLVRNRRQTLCQNVGRAETFGIGDNRFAVFFFRDDEDFFETGQVGRRLHPNVEKQFLTRRNLGYGSDGKALGKYLIAAAGQNLFAGLDFFIGHDFFQHDFARRCSAQHALQARLFEDRTHTAGLIVDEQDLRSGLEGAQDFSHDPVGSNYRHVRLNPVARAFINVDAA